MSKWIKWKQTNVDGSYRYGEMPMSSLSLVLQDFEKLAYKCQKESDADHVIYAAMEYDKNDNPEMLRLYTGLTMNDKTFEERIGNHNGRIWAIHRRV